MLTPNQLEELNAIIDRKINGFVAQNISTDSLTTEEVKVLKNAGVDIASIKPKDLLINQSFALGIISGAVPKSVLNETTYNSFKKYLESGKFIPLNSYEKGVIRSIERQSLSDIKGIGQKFKQNIQGSIASAEREYYEDTIRRNISEGRAKKESIRSISNQIAKDLDAFGRDFDRIVQTVSHQAFSEGRIAFIERNYGRDAKFWVQVYSGACSICVKSYLTAGMDSKPILFKVGQLPPPQVNYGVKVKDQITTLPGRHPFCRCHIMPYIKGYVWDEDKKSFVPPDNHERKVDRKSKVKIKFGDKIYES